MSGGARPPWSAFRAALDRVGFRPSRKLGQNFLLDDAQAAAIARDADVRAGETVLEVGAGCGFLSVHLLVPGVRLVAVEIDRRLLAVAEELLRPVAARVGAELVAIRADALAGKHALAEEVLGALPASGPWRVASNLPYAAGTPLVAVLSRLPHPPLSMTVLVQLEVAERLAAHPGEAAWGPLGARVQLLYRPRLLRRVAPQLFWPRPRVESAVVRLDLLPERPPPAEIARFDQLVGEIFTHRRKTLRQALAARAGGPAEAEAWLARASLGPSPRPGELTLGELCTLAALAPPDPRW